MPDLTAVKETPFPVTKDHHCLPLQCPILHRIPVYTPSNYAKACIDVPHPCKSCAEKRFSMYFNRNRQSFYGIIAAHPERTLSVSAGRIQQSAFSEDATTTGRGVFRAFLREGLKKPN
jgi:hypothetical protein